MEHNNLVISHFRNKNQISSASKSNEHCDGQYIFRISTHSCMISYHIVTSKMNDHPPNSKKYPNENMKARVEHKGYREITF